MAYRYFLKHVGENLIFAFFLLLHRSLGCLRANLVLVEYGGESTDPSIILVLVFLHDNRLIGDMRFDLFGREELRVAKIKYLFQ